MYTQLQIEPTTTMDLADDSESNLQGTTSNSRFSELLSRHALQRGGANGRCMLTKQSNEYCIHLATTT